jgi:hypothetical protein
MANRSYQNRLADIKRLESELRSLSIRFESIKTDNEEMQREYDAIRYIVDRKRRQNKVTRAWLTFWVLVSISLGIALFL